MPPWINRFRHNSTVTKVVGKARAMARLEAPAAANKMICARATCRGVSEAARQVSRRGVARGSGQGVGPGVPSGARIARMRRRKAEGEGKEKLV